jgi:hypothetical protein
LAPGSSASDEEAVPAGYPRRLDHDLHEHRVQRLDRAGVGEGALDLRAEAVGIREQQSGRHPLREVERDSEIDEYLAGQVCRAGRLERRQRAALGEMLGLCPRFQWTWSSNQATATSGWSLK